jgi:hypothetical protein
MLELWWTCFATDSRYTYGYKLCSSSRRLVRLFVWDRLHTGHQQVQHKMTHNSTQMTPRIDNATPVINITINRHRWKISQSLLTNQYQLNSMTDSENIGCQETMRVHIHLQCYHLICITNKYNFHKKVEGKRCINEQVGEKRSTVCTHRYTDCLLQNMSTKARACWAVKNETLRQKRWFQFSHCELSIYM